MGAKKVSRGRLAIVLPLLAAGASVAGVLLLAGRSGKPADLCIESEPSGASVLLDGRLAGATPLTVTGLAPGLYSLRLEKEGCAPDARQVALGAGSVRLSEKLQPQGAGALTVQVQPAGAEVLLDGEVLGHTPLDLNNVAAGPHELEIRKTNFKTFSTRIDVVTGDTLEFKNFALEDLILTMLENAIEHDKQRVSNYCDLAHYYFANNKIKEAGDVYARAIQVSGTPLELPKEMPQAERDLEFTLRAQDISRLNDEIRKKSTGEGRVMQHDLAEFRARLQRQQEINADKHIADWTAVRIQAENLEQDGRFVQAEDLLLKHIDAAKGTADLPQAYITLISLRIRMKKISEVKQTYDEFSSLYASRPELARQAANALYSPAAAFNDDDRAALLNMAETLLRRGIAGTPPHSEISALCKFELGNVLCLQYKQEEAVPLYQESIDLTGDESTKELRGLRLIEALKVVKNFTGAKAVLAGMLNSPRPEIVSRAKQELQEIEGK